MKRFSTALLLPVVLLLSVPVSAQSIDTRLAELDAEDYEVRRAATDAMMVDESLTTGQLAAWYALADRPEAQQRLLMVARHHLLRQMRQDAFPSEGPGSIGVVQSMPVNPPVFDAEGQRQRPLPGEAVRPSRFVLITRVLEGFPASGRLHPLDRIVALDGETLSGNAFEDLMSRYQAQQEVTLTVLRSGEMLEVVIPLVNGDALGAMYAIPDFGLTDKFDRAWLEYQQEHFPPRDNNLVPGS